MSNGDAPRLDVAVHVEPSLRPQPQRKALRQKRIEANTRWKAERNLQDDVNEYSIYFVSLSLCPSLSLSLAVHTHTHAHTMTLLSTNTQYFKLNGLLRASESESTCLSRLRIHLSFSFSPSLHDSWLAKSESLCGT